MCSGYSSVFQIKAEKPSKDSATKSDWNRKQINSNNRTFYIGKITHLRRRKLSKWSVPFFLLQWVSDVMNVWQWKVDFTGCVQCICAGREMLTMEQIEAALYQKMKISEKLNEKQMERMEGTGEDLTMDRGLQKEHILKWFVETQAVLILCDGSFPPWFQGFISRQ